MIIDTINYALVRFGQGVNSDELKYLPNKTTDPNALNDKIVIILQIVFATMGAIAILVIAVAGLQYVLSNGDPQKTARAKDTIIYAVIGLVVAIMSFAIVTFVLGRLFV